MTAMRLEEAEILALRALAHVLGDERTLAALLVQTGVAAGDLRTQAERRDFQAGILTFLLDDERRAQAFCTAESVDPALLHRARTVLAGDAERGL